MNILALVALVLMGLLGGAVLVMIIYVLRQPRVRSTHMWGRVPPPFHRLSVDYDETTDAPEPGSGIRGWLNRHDTAKNRTSTSPHMQSRDRAAGPLGNFIWHP